MQTILDLLQTMTGYFAGRGVEPARRTAEWLLADHLGLPRLELYMRFEQPIDEQALDQLREKVRRRVGGEPLQYILGVTEFCGIELAVDTRALIPRPETELLAESVVERVGDRDGWVVDAGTGSGAIAIAVARRSPRARIVAIDRSADALALARENVARTGVGDRVALVRGDYVDALAPPRREVLAIVSNPPYVRSRDLAALPREVRDFEPAAALDGGDDGLDAYRRIVPTAAARLGPGAFVSVEVGAGQSPQVAAMLRDAGFSAVETAADYAGIERIVTAQR